MEDIDIVPTPNNDTDGDHLVPASAANLELKLAPKEDPWGTSHDLPISIDSVHVNNANICWQK